MPFLSLTKCPTSSHRLGTFHFFIQICFDFSRSGTDPPQKTLSGFVVLLGPLNTTSMTQLYCGVHSLPGCLLMDKLHLFTHSKTKPKPTWYLGCWCKGPVDVVPAAWLPSYNALSQQSHQEESLCYNSLLPFPYLFIYFLFVGVCSTGEWTRGPPDARQVLCLWLHLHLILI